MKIFNGKKIADGIISDLKKKIKKEKIQPRLAVISVGKNKESELFIRNKKRAAKKVGINVLHLKFKDRVQEETILRKIKELNKSSSVNGIIVQLPLPKRFNVNKIISKVASKKDVDGFKKGSTFSPPLISAILIALKNSAKDLKNKRILALVNSDIFGKNLKKSLKRERIKISYSKKKSPKIRSADIIITVLGSANFIKGKMIKDGAILIDAGIKVLDKNKVVGDIDKKSVKKKASFLTPVPGGIGPLTVALLLKNAYLATKICK